MVVADIVCVVTSAVEQDSHSLKPNHDYIHAKTIHIVCSFALSLEPGKPNNKQSPKSPKKMFLPSQVLHGRFIAARVSHMRCNMYLPAILVGFTTEKRLSKKYLALPCAVVSHHHTHSDACQCPNALGITLGNQTSQWLKSPINKGDIIGK